MTNIPKPHPHDSTLGESSREAQSGRRLLGTGDLRELHRVPLRGEGSCGGGGAPRDSAGSGTTEEGLMRPQKFPDTLGSLEGNTEGLVGSLLLSPGSWCAQVLFVPSKSLFPQSYVSSWMVASSLECLQTGDGAGGNGLGAGSRE